jgi:DNA-binding IclR family transcriptional regulator
MARKRNFARLQAIYETIDRHPGRRAGHVARDLSLSRSTVTRTLPSLEEEGYLLCEDDSGRLWTFVRRPSS